MMHSEMYSTSTDNSFLQALGPYRIHTTSKPFSGVYYADMENITHTIKVGEISYHGEKQVEQSETKQKDLV